MVMRPDAEACQLAAGQVDPAGRFTGPAQERNSMIAAGLAGRRHRGARRSAMPGRSSAACPACRAAACPADRRRFGGRAAAGPPPNARRLRRMRDERRSAARRSQAATRRKAHEEVLRAVQALLAAEGQAGQVRWRRMPRPAESRPRRPADEGNHAQALKMRQAGLRRRRARARAPTGPGLSEALGTHAVAARHAPTRRAPARSTR